MHLVVIRSDMYERNRWVARSLFEAFSRAKHAAWDRLRFTGTLAAMVPWLVGALEDAEDLFGGKHYWPYGVPANRVELDTMLEWAHRHGVTVSRLAVEDLFAPETLELACE
jgi:4,5-dihydroxyphthalate decarboxylase